LPYTTEQWRRCLIEVGRMDIMETDWFSDPTARSRNIEQLYSLLSDAMPEKTTQEWLSIFAALDVPHAKVNGLDDLLTDPHLGDVGFFAADGLGQAGHSRALQQPVVFHDLPRDKDRMPPSLGSDGSQILQEAGFSPSEIDALIHNGVVRSHRRPR